METSVQSCLGRDRHSRPPSRENAFFITTNLVITPNQTRGECSELPTILPCRTDSDCKNKTQNILAHGVSTGRCNQTSQSCQLSAWCPLEEDDMPLGADRALLENTKSFTVLIKNSISFPRFGKRRTNILDWQNSSYLATCRNSEQQPFCPVFKLGDIVEAAGCNYSQMAVKGGVMNLTSTGSVI